MGNNPLSKDDLNKILGIAMEIGNALLQCGGEVRRVEDAISRICLAYGCTDADVFSLTSEIVATASYVLRPRAPLSWLDPGVFGTLGVVFASPIAASIFRRVSRRMRA